MMQSGVAVLFDMGATHTRVALTSDGREFERPIIFETDHSSSGLSRLAREIKSLSAGSAITCVIGGIPGHLDPVTHVLGHAPNLPQWEGLAIGLELKQQLGLPVQLENDTSLVGLGEAVYGAGKGSRIVMYETVSTGVNAVRVVNGRIDPAAVGFEVGAQLIARHDGSVTNLETATGGAALQRRQGRPPRELASAALWRDEAKLLAYGLYNSVVHWSPDVVVFGGSMMHDIAVEAIARELEALPPVYRQWPKLLPARLGDIGGLYGALALLK